MPYKAKYPCKAKNCPELIRKGSYCEKHYIEPKNKEYVRKKDNRPSAWKRGYNKEFYKIRAQLLKESPICQICNIEKSTVAHHMPDYVPGTNHKDYDYMAVCHGCHNRVTKAKTSNN